MTVEMVTAIASVVGLIILVFQTVLAIMYRGMRNSYETLAKEHDGLAKEHRSLFARVINLEVAVASIVAKEDGLARKIDEMRNDFSRFADEVRSILYKKDS